MFSVHSEKSETYQFTKVSYKLDQNYISRFCFLKENSETKRNRASKNLFKPKYLKMRPVYIICVKYLSYTKQSFNLLHTPGSCRSRGGSTHACLSMK